MNNNLPAYSQFGTAQMNLKTEKVLTQKSVLQSQRGQMAVLQFEPYHFERNHA